MKELAPPYPLIRDGLQQGKVIPFLGSGASWGRRMPDAKWVKNESNFLPTASELAEHLAQMTEFPKEESHDLAKVAQYFKIVGGGDPLQKELHSIFSRDYPLTSLHTFLAGLSPPLLIITTNYDDLIERAFMELNHAHDLVIHTADSKKGDRILWWPYKESEPQYIIPNKLDIDLESVTVIYKMHGAVDRREEDRDQYVITEDHYIDFLTRMTKKKAIPAIFAEPFQTRHFLFLGYSLNDWNFRVVLNRIEKDLRRPKEVKSWAIQNRPSPLERRFWLGRNVEVYDMLIDDFLKEL